MSTISRISKQPISLEEQETVINIDYVAKTAYVYTCHSPTVKKIYKLAEEYPDDVHIVRDDSYGILINVPMKWIAIKTPKKVTNEQKQAMAERMKVINQKKKEKTA